MGDIINCFLEMSSQAFCDFTVSKKMESNVKKHYNITLTVKAGLLCGYDLQAFAAARRVLATAADDIVLSM